MSKFKSKKDNALPAVNTASLPDIVFMLLFFFMVVTVMREDTLKIENRLPQADQVEKLEKKYPISYIYAGKPAKGYENLGAERAGVVREELVDFLTVSLKVDKEANMGIVGDIKKELRKANALKINYSVATGSALDN